MEIQFQQVPVAEAEAAAAAAAETMNKFKGKGGRSRSRSKSKNKYVGVRQRPSGRWVAEIKDTTQKIRMWLGTFETAEEAARAYDEAACLLRGSNTRTNFVTDYVSPDSPLASRIRNLLNNRKQKTNPKTKTPNNTPTSSSSSSSSSLHSVSPSCQKIQENNLLDFDDAYKPDMISNLCDEFDIDMRGRWGLEQAFDHRFPFSTTHQDQFMDMSKNNVVGFPETGDLLQFTEFERIKVERQISASLYAMNGVQEYMETVFDPIETLWDLPPFSSLLS
ncbi:hypothetical protein M9H77_12087 [Catharanthus roseus]|uniref:Uncharacterized protein n=1 Tax=Catharanthus roseus TaxID=4058 RepID=A0ACC0BGM0_CATRO|nr:hypothetical protein M9H77_12087 [Catharanthus roseus]